MHAAEIANVLSVLCDRRGDRLLNLKLTLVCPPQGKALDI
jgi:hypothetical protein